jgi:hypothetical protein
MAIAICYNCGEIKSDAFVPCENCSKLPEKEDDLVLSLAMTDLYLSNDKLEELGFKIKKGETISLGAKTENHLRKIVINNNILDKVLNLKMKLQSDSFSIRDYNELIRRTKNGNLDMFIDLGIWREFLYKADPGKLHDLIKRPVMFSINMIKFLSWFGLFVLFISGILSIPSFKWWSILVFPLIIIIGFFYQSRACLGRQRILIVSIVFILSIFVSIFLPIGSIWVRLCLVTASSSFLLIRLLYLITNIFVYNQIYRSFEFFKEFYKKPFIWTVPDYTSIDKSA